MRLAGQLDSQNIVFIHLFESYKIVSLSWHDLSARVAARPGRNAGQFNSGVRVRRRLDFPFDRRE